MGERVWLVVVVDLIQNRGTSPELAGEVAGDGGEEAEEADPGPGRPPPAGSMAAGVGADDGARRRRLQRHGGEGGRRGGIGNEAADDGAVPGAGRRGRGRSDERRDRGARAAGLEGAASGEGSGSPVR